MELEHGYQRTTAGVIPSDWDAALVGDLGKLKNGLNKDSDSFGHGSPFVNLMDVFGRSAIPSGDKLGLVATTPTEQQTYGLLQGDVLFIRSSVKPSGVGLTAVVEVDLPKTVYSGFLIRFRDGGRLANGFKRHCFFDEGFRRRIIAASSVSANTNINQSNLQRLVVALPPTQVEQEAIAEALSDADALIESLERLLAKKRQIKQGAMQELLTGQRRLPGFTEEWAARRLCEIVDLRKERIDPGQAEASEFCVELEHLESGTGCLSGFSATTEDSSFKSVFREGDVLFGKLRAYLRKYWLANRQGVCSTEIWVLVAKRSVLLPQFLFQLVMDDKFIDVASTAYGTHMPRSDWSVVRNYMVGLPSIAEQTAIATTLSDIDAELTALEARLAKTRQIKQGMMQALLTGRIRLVPPQEEQG